MLKEDHEVIPMKIKIKIIPLRSLLIDNPPSLGKVGHTTGVYVPYSLRTVVHVGSFTSHKNQLSEIAMTQDLRFKDSTFLSVI